MVPLKAGDFITYSGLEAGSNEILASETTCVNLHITTPSRANVTVKINPRMNDSVTLNTYTWKTKQSGTISVTCSSNVVNSDNQKMALWLNNGNQRLDIVSNALGKCVYSAGRTGRPMNLKCVSDLKRQSGLRTGMQTTARRRDVGW
jgi:hypothetical protein